MVLLKRTMGEPHRKGAAAMKVSKEKRDEIRRALVEAAVALFVEKGLAETSMREVAARAGVAPGTAYKYFPDRDKLLLAFFEMKFADAELALKTIAGFDSFGTKEKLQAFLEALLASYLPEREFVALSMQGLVNAPLQTIGAMQPVKQKLGTFVEGVLGQGVATAEIPNLTHQSFYVGVFWDYTVLVVLYWLKDDSEGFVKSSEFIDRSLDLYMSLIRSEVVEHGVRLLSFFVKNHLYGNLEQIAEVVGGLGQLREGLFGSKS
jgi:AcrR family transcriptional regulator